MFFFLSYRVYSIKLQMTSTSEHVRMTPSRISELSLIIVRTFFGNVCFSSNFLKAVKYYSSSSTMSPGLRSRLIPDMKPKIKKVPCNFKYILDKDAKDYLDKLVNIFKEEKVAYKPRPSLLTYIQEANHSSKEDMES